MGEQNDETSKKHSGGVVSTAKAFLKQETESPIAREMHQFRAVRWIIAISTIFVLWLVEAFSASNAWKAWVAAAIVLGAAVYFEIQALNSTAREAGDSSPPDKQDDK